MLRRFCVLATLAAVSSAHAALQINQFPGSLAVPNNFAQPPGESNRFFVIEQRFAPNSTSGRIRVYKNGSLLTTPFLSITGLANSSGEQGILGIAFHPNYATNRKFYVNYTRSDWSTVIEEVQASTTNPDVASAATRNVIMVYSQPFDNHNGGTIKFGPDGMLWISSGDGGAGNDPGDRAQNKGLVLGKLLRIDVNGDDFPGDANRDYRIPPDNPFASGGGAGEVAHYGLRNPWQFAFDVRENNGFGGLTIADVGQDRWEEVSYAKPGALGLNFGWRVREGAHNTGLGGTGTGPFVDPFWEYSNLTDGCAVSGGEIIRDPRLGVDLWGKYLVTDFCGAWLRAVPTDFNLETGEMLSSFPVATSLGITGLDGPVSISRLEDRSLLISDSSLGRVWRLTESSPSRAVSGTLVFNDVTSGRQPLGVLFQYRDASTQAVLASLQVGIPTTGQFTIPAPTGNMVLSVQHGTWLRRTIPVNTTGANVTGVNFSLINGDVDGDNEIGPGDFGQLATAFLSSNGDPNWNARADLDRDGEVGPGDFGILATNFLVAGDE